MSNRSVAVLQRFPHHLGLTDPGKRAGAVVDAIAGPLDELGRLAGDVRRAHRVGTARTPHDLALIGSLHELGPRALAPLRRRTGHVRATVTALGGPGGGPLDEEAAADLARATGTVGTALLEADAPTLADALAHVVSLDHELDVVRALVLGVVDAHRVGNATARAVLVAAGAYLGLAVEEVAHGADRWWHTARTRDLVGEGLPGGPDDDWLALEENPFVPGGTAAVARAHGDRFRVLRGGLEAVQVTVEVTGTADRTVAPMVVNLDAGRGVVFDGVVADGATLRFTAAGPVDVDGVDVTGRSYAFEGAVFAAGPPGEGHHPRDFVFAEDDAGDRTATFVVTTPVASAFSGGGLPHGAARVQALDMAVGESRWAFFVRVAHHGGGGRPAPAPASGLLDRSVLADADGGAGAAPSATVGFQWEEREPFAVRVLVPQRLADADDEDGAGLRQPLRSLLDRHVAAGVHVYVEYADDRWVLGSGVLRAPTSTDAVGTVVDGTALWGEDAPTDPPA